MLAMPRVLICRVQFACCLIAFVFAGACSCRSESSKATTAADSAAGCADDLSWGSFPDEAVFRNGDNDIDTLLVEFRFNDKAGKTWTARKDLSWDGASIPRALWTLVGSPKTGCHKLPSIVHDEYYKRHAEHTETRKEADEMFYQGCRAKGIGAAKAGAMYYALRWFGTPWENEAPRAETIRDLPQQEQFLRDLEIHLEATDVDLDLLDRLPPATLAQRMAAHPVTPNR